MSRLFDCYRALHAQAFVPIFVQDAFDSQLEIEACLEAGLRVIEYTQRRPDADRIIPWLRETYPELFILVGSTLDDDAIAVHCRRRHPQVRTIGELAAMGVDGFVSMLGWHPETIARYAPTHLLMPCAQTVNDAYRQVAAGAHFAKVLGPGLELVKACRAVPTFDFCPLMVTGGMTLERIPEAMAAGAALVGAGFDLMLRGEEPGISLAQATAHVRAFTRAAQEARTSHWTAPSPADGVSAWLDALPHYHPFTIDRPTEVSP